MFLVYFLRIFLTQVQFAFLFFWRQIGLNQNRKKVFTCLRPGGEGGKRSYLAQIVGYTFFGTLRYADFENRWWNVQIRGKIWFFRAQSWDIKIWEVPKTSYIWRQLSPKWTLISIKRGQCKTACHRFRILYLVSMKAL